MNDRYFQLMATHNASVVPNKLRVCVTKAQRLGGGRVDGKKIGELFIIE